MDPVVAEREQWTTQQHAGVGVCVAVAYERNAPTPACRDAGIEALTIAGLRIGYRRGGPRCMSWSGRPRSALEWRFMPGGAADHRQLGSQTSRCSGLL